MKPKAQSNASVRRQRTYAGLDDDVRRQRRVVADWSDSSDEWRRLLVDRLAGRPMIPELAALVEAERARQLLASQPTDFDRAMRFLADVVRGAVIAGGQTMTVSANVDALTATLVVQTDDGMAARFDLTDDSLTPEMATRHAVNARGRA